MKVVIDTNVVLSAALRDAGPDRLIRWVVTDRACVWIASPEIILEYREVLYRPKFALEMAELARWEEIIATARIISSPRIVSLIKDRRDSILLDCAIQGGAEYLVTGDRALLLLGSIVTTRVLSVREFAAEVAL